MRSRALLAAAGIVFVAACGARSTLRDPPGISSGSGGTGSGTSVAVGVTATGATTGVGGGPIGFCSALVTREPLVQLPASDAKSDAHDPLLQALGQGDVLALMRREAIEGPTADPSIITAVRLDPWSVWPPAIQPPVNTISNAAAIPFVSSVEPTSTFALGIVPFPANAPPGCDLQAIYGLSPGAPAGPGALTVHVNGNCDDFPVAIATGGDGTHLIANDVFAGDKNGKLLRGLNVDIRSADGTMLAQSFACAGSRFVGDVLPTANGVLLVHSAADSLDCSNGIEPGRRLFLRRFEGGKEDEAVVAYDGFDDLVYTRILPRQVGSWILYRESGASAEVQPPGMAMPFGADSALGESFPITDPGAGRMAAAALGGGFVVGIVDALDPTAPTVLLRVYSAEGALTAQTSFSTNDAWLNGDRLTLLGSPDGTSFLVGWTGASGGSTSAMFVRRFDCADSE